MVRCPFAKDSTSDANLFTAEPKFNPDIASTGIASSGTGQYERVELDSQPIHFPAMPPAGIQTPTMTAAMPRELGSEASPAETHELPITNSRRQSLVANTASVHSRAPSEQVGSEHTPTEAATSIAERQSYSDVHHDDVPQPSTPSSLTASTAVGTASPRNSYISSLQQQQKKIRDERARLTRLQELEEMEARLEEQLQRELLDDRRGAGAGGSK